MSTPLAEAMAFSASAKAVVTPLRELLGRIHNGFLSNEDAAWFRKALAEVGRLCIEGEQIAERLGEPAFTEWVESLRETETSFGRIIASGRPVYAS